MSSNVYDLLRDSEDSSDSGSEGSNDDVEISEHSHSSAAQTVLTSYCETSSNNNEVSLIHQQSGGSIPEMIGVGGEGEGVNAELGFTDSDLQACVKVITAIGIVLSLHAFISHVMYITSIFINYHVR